MDDYMYMAITALFPYAAQQEQDGQNEVLKSSLQALGAMGVWGFMSSSIEPFIATLLDGDSSTSLKQTAILVSPHLPWKEFVNSKHLIQLWAAAASVVTYTDEIGQSVVDTLLEVASGHELQPHIPAGMWLWLNECPLLPPVSKGCHYGSVEGVVKMVRALGDSQILKSYLIHIWSEWGYLHDWYNHCGPNSPPNFYLCGLPEMCISIMEDFGGIRMGHYRKDLLHRLDHILRQLDLGLEYLQQNNPSLHEDDVQEMKDQYGELRRLLTEVDEAVDILIRKLSILVFPLDLLTFKIGPGYHSVAMCTIPLPCL